MADQSVRVEVKGLAELSKAFKAVDEDVASGMKDAFLGIAREVVGTAQQRMPHNTGRAQSSVKPRATAKGAGIAFGGNKAPYMPWLDFGGSVGRGHQPGQAWSGAIKRDWRGKPGGMGRYVYPAISDSKDEIIKAVEELVEDAARKHSFETRD